MIEQDVFSTVMEISVDELREQLEEPAQDERPIVLDVRPEADWQEWSIPGSLHVDAYARLNANDPAALEAVDLSPQREVVTVCGAGRTSLTAAAQLRRRGMPARSLAGGMKAWSLAWNTAEIALPDNDAVVLQVRRTGKGCLSYVIGSRGTAAVIDPSLDPEVYLQLASQRGWTIAHVLETHIHADHLMRSRLLAARTGATLHLPESDRVAFDAIPLRDGDRLTVGEAVIDVLATPGHTLESVSFLLDGEALFTGDTLFLAAVGRPDLEASPEQAGQRARLLHRSLRRLLALPPQTVILPGHTSQPVAFDGSPLQATLEQVRSGVPLLAVDEDTFARTLLERLPPTPPNHHTIVELNQRGVFPAGDPTDLEAGANRCAIA
jgi:glyoxylase-like metal-dependent hydrolase (beta-lactamase superfamily II)